MFRIDERYRKTCGTRDRVAESRTKNATAFGDLLGGGVIHHDAERTETEAATNCRSRFPVRFPVPREGLRHSSSDLRSLPATVNGVPRYQASTVPTPPQTRRVPERAR